MRRPGLLALTFLAPLCFVLCFYLQGYGVLPSLWGFTLAIAVLFIGTPVVSVVVVLLCFESALARVGAFFGLLFVQVVIFCVVPPGAQIEMLGIAHHLKRNFPVPVVSECAISLVQRFNNGTLMTSTMPSALLYSPINHPAAVVAESELPQILRGKFRCVTVCTNRGNTEVFFEYEPHIGIVCTPAEFSKTVFHRKLADGIYAYHYQRP